MHLTSRRCRNGSVQASSIGKEMGQGAFGSKLAVALNGVRHEPEPSLTHPCWLASWAIRSEHGDGMRRTLAKYLQGAWVVAGSAEWEKGQALPAWQAPCKKNLQGTWEVSFWRGEGEMVSSVGLVSVGWPWPLAYSCLEGFEVRRMRSSRPNDCRLDVIDHCWRGEDEVGEEPDGVQSAHAPSGRWSIVERELEFGGTRNSPWTAAAAAAPDAAPKKPVVYGFAPVAASAPPFERWGPGTVWSRPRRTKANQTTTTTTPK